MFLNFLLNFLRKVSQLNKTKLENSTQIVDSNLPREQQRKNT